VYESREVAINRIKLKKRVRRDLGDLTSLMNSLREYGQLTPIILNTRYELIAGNRRLESARKLGWESINAIVVKRNTDLEMLELEIEENIQRRDLSPEELSDGFDRLDRLRNPGLLRRILNWLIRFFRRIFGRKS
jgi:ParB family chromosome partitioning protein